MVHLLQQLYDACKETFPSSPLSAPSPQRVQLIKSVLDAMTLADLGLDEDILVQVNKSIKFPFPVFYLHVHRCLSFSIGIFYLPKSAVIALHDHPQMTVFSKLLLGSVHVKAYDWVDPPIQRREAGALSARLARLVVDETFTVPCESSIFDPTGGGNIHTLTGVTHCAVLDVLAPPYSSTEGRPCKYYNDSPSGFRAEAPSPDCSDHAWLKERQLFNDNVISLPYEPPHLVL